MTTMTEREKVPVYCQIPQCVSSHLPRQLLVYVVRGSVGVVYRRCKRCKNETKIVLEEVAPLDET